VLYHPVIYNAANDQQIKRNVQNIVESVMEQVQNDSTKEHFLVKK
jgi:hypothetical protein